MTGRMLVHHARRGFTAGYVCVATRPLHVRRMRVNPGLRPTSGRAIVALMNSLVETGLAHAQAPYSLQQLVEALSAALPSHCVLFREEDTRPYECDGLSLYRALPAVVALPETEEQVQLLRSLDCDGAQGFWFSKAIPAEEFERRYLCD